MNIQENSFFEPFSEQAVRDLVGAALRRECPDGTMLFSENDAADGVYLVLSGASEMVKTARNNSFIPLSKVLPGDYFGEVGVIDGCGRSTGARASGDAVFAFIPAKAMLDALRSEPIDVTFHFCRRVSAYLRTTDSKFVHEVINKERVQLIGEMARSIIHDFKNPMTSIQLASDLIQQVSGDARVEECCVLITSQVKRMVAMAEELLDYSRGAPSLNRMPVPVKNLLRDLEFLNADFLRSSNVQWTFEPSDMVLDIDRDRMMRVVQNLISNSVEAMGGGGAIAVRVEKVDDKQARLIISDTGCGIPDEIRDTVFEPFVTFGKKKGTGIGMAVVKSVVEAHGGTVSFESEKGKGTTFILTLPRSV